MDEPLIPRFTACFSGNRPHKLPWGSDESDRLCEFVRLKLIAAVVYLYHHEGVTTFLTGMAEGIDILAGEQVLAYRDSYPGLRLVCCTPYPGFGNNRSARERERYYSMLERADARISVSERYERGCFDARNRFMVDSSSFLIAASSGAPGGTLNTIRYAERMQKTVYTIDLNALARQIYGDTDGKRT